MFHLDQGRVVGSFESQFDTVVNEVKNQTTSSEVQQAATTLSKLNRAYESSLELDLDIWEFAIEISDFEIAGISKQVLRQMVASGWIEHKREVILPNLECRQFHDESLHTLSKQTCFVITELGREKHEQIFGGATLRVTRTGFGVSRRSDNQPRITPVWDKNRRELRLGDHVVKAFRWPAEVQFIVLERFENLGWPDRISDPLPKNSNVDPKRRLHDAIKCLNQRRENELIRFHGDGTGSGVVVRIRMDLLEEMDQLAEKTESKIA